jgi:Uma2 family endonuclease
MNTAHKLPITEQDYLGGELASDLKHEFIDGQVYAMTGTSDDHNRISVNVLSEFRQQLKGQPCEPFMADMKLKAAENIYYPDVMVICQPDDADTKLVKHGPAIIVEVLSPSTRRTDLTIKKEAFLNLPSLQEYVVIEQASCQVLVFRRKDNWGASYYFLGDTIAFESIDVSLSVEEIYDRVVNDDMTAFLREKEIEAEG